MPHPPNMLSYPILHPPYTISHPYPVLYVCHHLLYTYTSCSRTSTQESQPRIRLPSCSCSLLLSVYDTATAKPLVACKYAVCMCLVPAFSCWLCYVSQHSIKAILYRASMGYAILSLSYMYRYVACGMQLIWREAGMYGMVWYGMLVWYVTLYVGYVCWG